MGLIDRNKKSTLKAKNRPNIVFIIILAILVIGELIPLYLVLVNLFKDSDAIRLNPFILPKQLSFDNLIYVLTDKYKSIWELYKNSILITSLGTVLSIIVSAMLAYYIVRSPGKVSNFLFTYFISALSISGMLLFVPLAYMLRILNLTTAGIPVLVVIYIAFDVSFGMYIYGSFIRSIPMEIEEAAIIDGATHWQIFWRIIMPLIRPATMTIAIFIGCDMWNDFLTPLLLGGGIETITTGIYSAVGSHTTDWGRVFAYVFMACLPTVVFFLTSQKKFISGMVSGAVKG